MSKIKYLLLISLVVLSVSCSAEDGTDGADGMDGAQGPAGPAGEDGNANVISILVEGFELEVGNNEISIPELTNEIASNGLVQGYIAGTEVNQWFSLPFSQLVEVVTETEDGPGTTFTSTIVLEVLSIEPGQLVVFSLIEGPVNLRFVLVEGNVSSVDISDML
ncbi:hypothetical protein MHTCC0001_25430 [Flavobacteriaceae bacterium MHTCC 0001]